jgi:hypothetical protein
VVSDEIPPELMSEIFTDLQVAVANKLRVDEWFTKAENAAVLAEDSGDVVSLLDMAVQKTGFGVVVLTPEIEPSSETVRMTVNINVRIVERVTVNRSSAGTHRTALDTVAVIVKVLQNIRPSDEWSECLFRGARLVQLADPIVWEVNFTTHTIN